MKDGNDITTLFSRIGADEQIYENFSPTAMPSKRVAKDWKLLAAIESSQRDNAFSTDAQRPSSEPPPSEMRAQQEELPSAGEAWPSEPKAESWPVADKGGQSKPSTFTSGMDDDGGKPFQHLFRKAVEGPAEVLPSVSEGGLDLAMLFQRLK